MKVFVILSSIIGIILISLVTTSFASLPVKVAILDSGSNISYREGISFIDTSVKDYNGHGTLMASIVKEICPEAELYIIKVAGKDGLVMNENAVIMGLEWAISKGVNVINMSLRLKGSERLHALIKKAFQNGITVIAAAGNNTTRMGKLAVERDISLKEVAYPAKYEDVIAVGALDRRNKAYTASIRGKEVEIFCKGYKGKHSGTSIASAYASGFAAKIISKKPELDYRGIKDVMRQAYLNGKF